MAKSRNSKLKVGIVGLGIGSLHAQGYSKCPEVEILAICDPVEEKVNRVAAQYGVQFTFTDYREMLRLKDLDAVSVCTPNYLHARVTIDCLRAGKHVICEKPLATTPKEGEAMVKTAMETGKLLMTAFNNRFRGDTQTLKRFIENGDLGEIYFAKCGWIRRKGIPGFGSWFTQKSKAGGGPLLDIGVHVLDMTLWLMGSPKATSVSGATYAKFGPFGLGRGTWGCAEESGTFDVEDMGVGFIRLETGATIMLEASWASHIKADRYYASLMGTKGGADIDPFCIYTDINGAEVDITPNFPHVSGHEMEIRHFVDCLVKGTKCISTGEDGLEAIRILDAIYRSAETGKEVRLK